MMTEILAEWTSAERDRRQVLTQLVCRFKEYQVPLKRSSSSLFQVTSPSPTDSPGSSNRICVPTRVSFNRLKAAGHRRERLDRLALDAGWAELGEEMEAGRAELGREMTALYGIQWTGNWSLCPFVCNRKETVRCVLAKISYTHKR